MSKPRLLSLVAPIVLFLLLCGIGTQALADNRYWKDTVSDGDWSLPGNWTLGVAPAPGDHVYFTSDAVVTIGSVVSIGALNIDGGAHVGLVTNGTLTVTGATVLSSSAEITLSGAAATSLALNGLVQFTGGALGEITEITAASLQKVELGPTSTLLMGTSGAPPTQGDLRYTYFGENVNVWICSPSGMLLTDVRFNYDITVACELNIGSSNVWLGKNADILRSETNNQNQKFITFVNQAAITGLVVKEAEYWKDGNGYDPSVGYFEFNIGADKLAAFRIDINHAHELDDQSTPTWSGPSASEPFRGVGVRAVNMVHPENTATNRYAFYWVAQPIGLDQDNYNDGASPTKFPDYVAPANAICYQMEFHPGYIQGSPQVVTSARYTDNYEEVGANGNWYNDGSNDFGTSISGRVFVTQCSAIGFGDLTIGVGEFIGDPVPVELTSFSAYFVDRSVRLKWKTATELNNYGFDIERSMDRVNWEKVGFVPGFGTSSSPKNYYHTDELDATTTHAPELAYRLRQIDRDGTFEYSNTVFVKTDELPDGPMLYPAYPNPFNPSTTISYSLTTPSTVTIKVFDALGRCVATLLDSQSSTEGVHTIAFDGSSLASGVYTLVLRSGGTVQIQKLLLNR